MRIVLSLSPRRPRGDSCGGPGCASFYPYHPAARGEMANAEANTAAGAHRLAARGEMAAAARDAHRFILIASPPAGRRRCAQRQKQTVGKIAGRVLGMRLAARVDPPRPRAAAFRKARPAERSGFAYCATAPPPARVCLHAGPSDGPRFAPPRRPRGSASMSAPATAPGLRRPAARGFCALEARFAPQAVALKGCRALPAASVFERRPAQARGPRRTLYAARVSCYNECVAGLSRDEKLRREPLWMR